MVLLREIDRMLLLEITTEDSVEAISMVDLEVDKEEIEIQETQQSP